MTLTTAIENLPDQSVLETRFDFIDDDTLRTNVGLTFRYIIFLITLEKELNIPGPILYSLRKNIILFTASIIESCLHHALRRKIDSGEINSKEVMPFEWKLKESNKIYEVSQDENIVAGKSVKTYEQLKRTTRFLVVIRAARKAEILDDKTEEKVENIRKLRNRIHLAGLDSVDDLYEKSKVNEVFESSRLILDKIRSYL